MNTRIVYIDENNDLIFHTIAPAMFDANHPTRNNLKLRGIDFNNDQEIIDWVAKNVVPANSEYYLVDANNFPKNADKRNIWYYDKESNSVKDE